MDIQDLSKLRIEREPAQKTFRRRLRVPWWLVALLIAGAIAAWFFLGRGRVFEVETVGVTAAYPSQALTLLNATGYVVAQRKAAVASKATGRLEWLGVTEGSRVKANEVIARLESLDVRAAAERSAANIKAAQANVAQVRAEQRDADQALRRARDLAQQNFISKSAVDEATARYDKARAGVNSALAAVEVAKAALREAEVSVEQTLIRAPFDGVVLSKSANVGDIVTPFSSAVDSKGAVVTMADMDTLEVEADVGESNLQKIRIDQPVEIQLDAFPEQRFGGVVSRMVPTIDRSKATILVKVRFIERDEGVLPEMSAKVAFLERAVGADERKPVTATNPNAIVTRDGKRVAFLVEGEQVRAVNVQTGRALGDMVEVQGVKPGDKLVLKPAEKLISGAKISVEQK